MTRRQFSLRALREIRGREQSRAQERLAEVTEPEPHDSDSMTDTRRDIKPVSGPLSDRLKQIDPQRFNSGEEAETAEEEIRTAVLEDVMGRQLATLACDEAAGIIILGRGQNATVKINDPYVHRVHAHMRWDTGTGAHIIIHGGGENATYVNRQKIRGPHTLQNGHRIRLGRTEMIYRIG